MKKEERMSNPFMKSVLVALATTSLAGCMVTPEIMSDGEHALRVQKDVAALYEGVEPVDAPLTLSEAISRSLLYNFNYKMGLMEEVLQNNQLTLANFNMLPRLAANAGYGWRDSERATQSISLNTRTESLEHSFSEERVVYNADLGFSWNILDFGLSYYQARQQSDRVLAAVEQRRRVMNNMIKETQSAYWKAAFAQEMLPKVEKLIVKLDEALDDSKEIERKRLQSPAKTLEYRKTLLQTMSQLKQLRSDLLIAKAQLRSLINLPPSQEFTVAGIGKRAERIPDLPVGVDELQSYSLVFRPEIREEAYQERIDRQNVTKEIIRLFPGLSLLGSKNFNSNRYLAFQNWEELGVKATWNLINLLQAPKALENAKMQVEISEMRRLALSAAVLSQVSISYNQYMRAVENYKTAKEISNIDKKLLKVSRDSASANRGTRLEQIQKEAQAIAAALELNNAMIDVRDAYMNLVVSSGIDLVPSVIDGDMSLDEATAMVEDAIRGVESGELVARVRERMAELEKEVKQAQEEEKQKEEKKAAENAGDSSDSDGGNAGGLFDVKGITYEETRGFNS